MSDDTRTELRATVDRLVRLANAGVGVTCELRPQRRCPPEDTPPLTTAQQLALSVLVGEPDRAVLSALCDLLIEMGHEYAAAVAEKARREERERALKGIDKRIATWATEMQRADTRAAREQSLGCAVRISELQVIADLLREPT